MTRLAVDAFANLPSRWSCSMASRCVPLRWPIRVSEPAGTDPNPANLHASSIAD